LFMNYVIRFKIHKNARCINRSQRTSWRLVQKKTGELLYYTIR